MKQGVLLKHLHNNCNATFYTKSGTRIGRTKFVSDTCVEYLDRDDYRIGDAREVSVYEGYPYVEFRERDGYVWRKAYISAGVGGFHYSIDFYEHGSCVESIPLDIEVVDEIRERNKETKKEETVKKDPVKQEKTKQEETKQETEVIENRWEEKQRKERDRQTTDFSFDLATWGPFVFWGLVYLITGSVLSSFLQEPLAKVRNEAWWLFDGARILCLYAAPVVALLLQLRAGKKIGTGKERWITLGLTAAAYVGLSVMLHRVMLHGGFGILDGISIENLALCFAPLAVFGGVAGILNLIFRKSRMYTWTNFALEYVNWFSIIITTLGYILTYFVFKYDVNAFFSLYFELTKMILLAMVLSYIAKLPFKFFDWIYWTFPRKR